MHDNVFDLWRELHEYGYVSSPRGLLTKELLNTSLTLVPDEWFIETPALPLREDYVKAELKWYINGDPHDLSICDHASIWKDCVDNNGMIQSNYGWYFNAQCKKIKKLLREDPNSRRAVININQPQHNYLGAPDVPCTIYLAFLLRQGKLHMHAHMRSQDAVYGLRNDIPAFQMFKLFMAEMLDVPPGNLVITCDSFHVYEKHFEKLKEATRDESQQATGFTTVNQFYRWLYGKA